MINQWLHSAKALVFAATLSTTFMLFSAPASAALIRVDFGGSLTEVDATLANTFAIGNSFSGSYLFDSDAIDTGNTAGGGTYAAMNYSVTINGYSATASQGEIETSLPSNGGDTYLSRSRGSVVGGTVDGKFPISSVLILQDNDKNIIQPDILPVTLDLDEFETQLFAFGFGDTANGDNNRELIGSLTSLSFTPVPVPAAVWLMGSGLLGLLGIARRKRAV